MMQTVASAPAVPSIPGRITHPLAFWSGVLLCTLGVLVHLARFLVARAASVSGVPPQGLEGLFLEIGVGLAMPINFGGLALATWGLLPRDWLQRWKARHAQQAAPQGSATAASGLAQMDSAGLSGNHWKLMSRLYVGMALDTMKPATLAFMIPGLRAEYGLPPSVVALLPFMALTGLTIGSIMFGLIGDVIGRRASFILTAIILASSSICGFMYGFPWQVGMCFIMGLAAGGELPVIYTLLAETMPARHRGWMSVVLGGLGGLTGFFLASMTAYLLEPIFTWRMLFIVNLPTALLMVLLVKWVPESPRFLMQMGHHDEAGRVMASLGATNPTAAAASGPVGVQEPHGVREVFGRRLRGTTLTLCLYGFAWGLCNWGFITWLPAMVRGLGYDPAFASRLLATSALLALPGSLLAAALYSLWSTRKSATLFALTTCVALVVLGLAQGIVQHDPTLLTVATVALLTSSTSMIGVLAPYSVELYPTALRGVGSGVVAAASKSGGLVGPGLVGGLLTISSALVVPALVIAAPLFAAGSLMALRARETRGKRLEELTAVVVAD